MKNLLSDLDPIPVVIEDYSNRKADRIMSAINHDQATIVYYF